jgi:hypothetical protein
MVCGSRAGEIGDIKRVDFWINPHFWPDQQSRRRFSLAQLRELARKV